MVKPLAFKGDKKVKKRKRAVDAAAAADTDNAERSSKARTTAAPAEPESDDSWVSADAASDINGPVVIVLPTDKAASLACDAVGKVFASELENIVDGDAATAEPHDVRQVFVANRVAGTDDFNLKGHHGRYLSCDKYGLLSANATAISPEERFLIVAIPDNPGAFALQTQRDKYLSIDESSSSGPEVRGDADDITFNTTFRIRMQARFKPRNKASKEEKAHQKISKKELEDIVGRRLNDDEVKKLRRARRENDFHEVAMDMRSKSSHDKYA
ncbi:frg1-like family protein [Stagonosporopsis vannaccii]|nr:frg1-like family protein [Stagonosporopsis vannaccii]